MLDIQYNNNIIVNIQILILIMYLEQEHPKNPTARQYTPGHPPVTPEDNNSPTLTINPHLDINPYVGLSADVNFEDIYIALTLLK